MKAAGRVHRWQHKESHYPMCRLGHEFRSLLSLMDCRVSGFHFPLVILIDYLYVPHDCLVLFIPEFTSDLQIVLEGTG
jgi:hypothetical protein